MSDFEFAKSLVLEAGEYLRNALRGEYETRWKPDNTPITSMDSEINSRFVEAIRSRYPRDRLYGEEESGGAETPEYTWVADPIDGTQSLPFFPTAMICLARVDGEGEPVFSLAYNPITRDLFACERGQGATLNGGPLKVSEKETFKSSFVFLSSRMHFPRLATNGVIYDRLEAVGVKVINVRSFEFSCMMVAAGKAEGAMIGVKTPFETATAKLIVEAAGGKVTDLYGNPLRRVDSELSSGVLISNGRLHDALIDTLRAAQ